MNAKAAVKASGVAVGVGGITIFCALFPVSIFVLAIGAALLLTWTTAYLAFKGVGDTLTTGEEKP